MSHGIIRSIKVKDGKVFLDAASSNVWPRSYSPNWVCPSLTQILQEEGQDALDIEILRQYEGYMFQGGNNKYTRALRVLQNMEEYEPYDWRNNNHPWGSAEYKAVEERRSSQAFKDLLLKAMKTQLPKDKFIISWPYYGRTAYMNKLTRSRASWCYNRDGAKIFKYRREAENAIARFYNTEEWSIEKVA